MEESFSGHAVVGVMSMDEVLLRVFGGTDSLQKATKYCEELVAKPKWHDMVIAECERLHQCNSEVMGINVLRIEAGIPVRSECWYGIKKGKAKDE